MVPYNGTTETPAYCRVGSTHWLWKNSLCPHGLIMQVIGHIAEYIGFEIRLPATGANWTGVFTQQGCGGSCGLVQLDGLHPLFATPERPFGESTGDACMKRGMLCHAY